ncbi:MAG: glycosyltransferase family 2 protein [Steroidobacteraceae bacterium]
MSVEQSPGRVGGGVEREHAEAPQPGGDLQGRAGIRVTIAIVTYRSSRELPACLDSIAACGVATRIVVIDNDSGDGTHELAQSYADRFHNIVAIRSAQNVGLAAANNLVIPYLEGDYVLILNPDTVLTANALSAMISIMDRDSTIGAIGPKCLYEDGTPHTSYHYGWGLWHLFVWRMLPYSFVRRLYDGYARYREKDVAFVSGACLLARADLFRSIRGYDPAYFLTVEDACDLCGRIRALGYRVRFAPGAVITHLCGRSGNLVPYLTTLEGYKGDIYYFWKHSGVLGACAAYLLIVLSCSVKIAIAACKALVLRREVDSVNLGVYRRILPKLLSRGPKIAFSTER